MRSKIALPAGLSNLKSKATILVSRTIDKIKELKERLNLTVLMAEQNFHQAVRIADRGSKPEIKLPDQLSLIHI